MGGHARAYREALVSIGVDLINFAIPPNLSIVQVGDLVRLDGRRGEGSAECVEISDCLLARNPLRFIQLWGNHELAALGGPRRSTWTAGLDGATVKTLARWWREGLSSASCVVRSGATDYLVSHAGLTRPNWLRFGAMSALETSRRINAELVSPERSRAGTLVTGIPNTSADVIWAEVTSELHESWAGNETPKPAFHQVHGHASIWNWDANGFWPDVPTRLATQVVVETSRRLTFAPLTPERLAMALTRCCMSMAISGRGRFSY